jgi:hypothetical protein
MTGHASTPPPRPQLLTTSLKWISRRRGRSAKFLWVNWRMFVSLVWELSCSVWAGLLKGIEFWCAWHQHRARNFRASLVGRNWHCSTCDPAGWGDNISRDTAIKWLAVCWVTGFESRVENVMSVRLRVQTVFGGREPTKPSGQSVLVTVFRGDKAALAWSCL